MSESESATRSETDALAKKNLDETSDEQYTTPTRREILDLIVECYNDLDQIDPPEVSEVAEYSGYSKRVFERAGRWNDLLREAGLPTLADLVDEWVAAYIEAGYGTSREFRTARLEGDFASSGHRLSRNALYHLSEETEAERRENGRKVEITTLDGVGEHTRTVWIGSLRDPNADPRPTHLRDEIEIENGGDQ